MCEPDWDDIPKAHRDDIWRTWNDGSGVDSDEFEAAIEAGIAAVSR